MRRGGVVVDVKPGRKYKVLSPTYCTRTTTYVKKTNETERKGDGDRALQRVESWMERYETCGLVVSGTPGPKGKEKKNGKVK